LLICRESPVEGVDNMDISDEYIKHIHVTVVKTCLTKALDSIVYAEKSPHTSSLCKKHLNTVKWELKNILSKWDAMITK